MFKILLFLISVSIFAQAETSLREEINSQGIDTKIKDIYVMIMEHLHLNVELDSGPILKGIMIK